MPETSKTNKTSWFSLISNEVLAAAGAPPQGREGADYPRSGSVCTSRYSGSEPPDSAIDVIARIR